MNILALDFGTKRIGMAWVDTNIGVVLPFGVVTVEREKVVEHLIEFITREHIEKVIVGLPLGLKGEENENTLRVREFVRELRSYIQIPVEVGDERFSSHAADKLIGEASRDEKAAMVILEGYLERNKH